MLWYAIHPRTVRVYFQLGNMTHVGCWPTHYLHNPDFYVRTRQNCPQNLKSLDFYGKLKPHIRERCIPHPKTSNSPHILKLNPLRSFSNFPALSVTETELFWPDEYFGRTIFITVSNQTLTDNFSSLTFCSKHRQCVLGVLHIRHALDTLMTRTPLLNLSEFLNT